MLAAYGPSDQAYGATSAVPSVAPETAIVSLPSRRTDPRFAASSATRSTVSPLITCTMNCCVNGRSIRLNPSLVHPASLSAPSRPLAAGKAIG